MNSEASLICRNDTPECYTMPPREAAKMGHPVNAVDCTFARLESTLMALSADGTNEDGFTLNHKHVMNLLWAIEGHVKQLKYLFEVQHEHDKLLNPEAYLR